MGCNALLKPGFGCPGSSPSTNVLLEEPEDIEEPEEPEDLHPAEPRLGDSHPAEQGGLGVARLAPCGKSSILRQGCTLPCDKSSIIRQD